MRDRKEREPFGDLQFLERLFHTAQPSPALFRKRAREDPDWDPGKWESWDVMDIFVAYGDDWIGKATEERIFIEEISTELIHVLLDLTRISGPFRSVQDMAERVMQYPKGAIYLEVISRLRPIPLPDGGNTRMLHYWLFINGYDYGQAALQYMKSLVDDGWAYEEELQETEEVDDGEE